MTGPFEPPIASSDLVSSAAIEMTVMSEPSTALRVLIADDHPAMRDGLARAIAQESNMTVVGIAVDGVEAVTQFSALRPDVVLMDLQMPRRNGLQAIAEIRAHCANACLVVLTSYAGDARVSRALELGAASYILKTSRTETIITTIRSACNGRTVLGPEVSHDLEQHRGMEPLTPREVCVLRLVAAGRRNRHIGEELNVSEQTIKSRIKNILAKLNAHDRSHAVALAMKRGFLDH
jgi:DNA-binding NarL/FixJ family response regulator